MAFNQYNLERVHDQSRGGFDLFVYHHDTDTIADITASGYFDETKFGFKSPGNNPKLIKVQCADGPYEVQLVGGVASVVGKNDSPSQAGRLISKLESKTSDAVVLVISDSTGNEDFEFVYLFAQWIADSYPSFSVDYYLWDDGAGDYASAESINTGSSGFTVSIYNGAIPGSRPDYLMGDKFNNAVFSIPKADLVIFNHGHNIGGSADWNTTNSLDGRAPYIYSAAFQVLDVHSNAGIIFNGQNPKRDDNFNRPVQNAIQEAARVTGGDVTNSYYRFEQAGKAAEYYNDNTHPSSLGHSELILPALLEFMRSPTPKSPNSIQVKNNLLLNGDFSTYSTSPGIPANWTGGNATATKDTVNYEGAHGWSVNIVSASSGSSSRIEQSVNTSLLPRLIGKRVTLAARVFVPDGEPDSAGRIVLQSNGVQVNSRLTTTGQGGFKWVCVSMEVPTSATFLKCLIYGDSSGTDGNASFDRVIMFKGEGVADYDI